MHEKNHLVLQLIFVENFDLLRHPQKYKEPRIAVEKENQITDVEKKNQIS